MVRLLQTKRERCVVLKTRAACLAQPLL
jgi:hypothetical protein